MNVKIIPFTLILMLFLSPAALLVNAQDNETEPSPGINGTIPVPTLDGNTTLPETNSTSTDVNGTDTDGEPVDPIILALIREQAQNRMHEMSQLLGEGTESPDFANGLMEAKQSMEQAMNFETSNPSAAANQYLQAMRQYRNLLRKYLNDNPGALNEFEEESIVNGTATDDVNGTVTETEISEAQTRLVNEFEERFRNQVTSMMQNVADLSDDMGPQDAFKAQQALTKAEQKLLRIQERIAGGQYDGVLDDLENATETLSDDFDETDPGTAQMLKTMNKLEAKIKKMEQKTNKGESTPEDDALLEQLRGNKDHTKNDFKENKGKGNSGNNGKPDKEKKEKKDKDK
jgi:hypothetical protein